MAGDERQFPEAPRFIAIALQEVFGVEHTGTRRPGDLAEHLPFAWCHRTGGPSDGLNDYATVEVDVFAATPTEAWQLAERARQALTVRGGPHRFLDRVGCDIGPRELPWSDDDSVVRYGATYEAVARRAAI